MAKKLTLTEFLDTLEKSKLLEPGRLTAFCQDQPEALTAIELADRMVKEGLLTKFQAENLLKGRWHRYFLGPYRVLDRVGMGSNGMVYLCEHTKMKRRVAVKVLQAEKAQNEEAVRRFEREAMAAAAVRHPNIVHAYDLCREDRLHYFVMEYVDGVNLLKKLTDHGRLAPRDAAEYLRQAASGLQVAHEAGVIHRDVKPSNLMITSAGQVKLLDLGLARYAGDEMELTRGDAVLGIAAYIAPEQAANSHTADARCDVYSLGATFYVAITGKKPPVYGDKVTPPPARTPAEEVDYRKLLDVIRKMMAPKPQDRYQTAAEVVIAITEFLKPGSPETVGTEGVTHTPHAVKPAPAPAQSLSVDTPAPSGAFSESGDRGGVAIAHQSATTTRAILPPIFKPMDPPSLPAIDRPLLPSRPTAPPPSVAEAQPVVAPAPTRQSLTTHATQAQSSVLSWVFLALASLAFVAAGAYMIWG
jgi:serine/threonine protein kinase